MRPEDALDVQRSLIEFWDSDIGVEYANGWIQSFANANGAVNSRSDGIKFRISERNRLAIAELYCVDDEMMDLVKYAADSLPLGIISRSDLPSDVGLVILPEPIYATDLNGKLLNVAVVTWIVQAGTLLVTYYSDSLAPDDYREGNLDDEMRRLNLRYQLAHLQFLDLNTELSIFEGEWESELYAAERWVLAFWKLCQETLVARERPLLGRAARRRWYRSTGNEPKVTVVRLRRRKGEALYHEDVTWHHRWIVRGHWRKQPCGPGRSQIRAVWISAYVKGPDDAPLLQSTKVNYLVR